MIKIADKTVNQPFVFVNGEWRSVKKESVSVNGSWRTVWEKGYAVTIKYYDGKTYTTQTLTTDSKSASIITGSVTTTVNAGGVVTGSSDTRENITCYSYISAKVTYYKYSSKTLAYRSSK